MGAYDKARTLAKDWLASIVIGFLTVSFWRGTWTLFDLWLCGQPEDANLLDATTFCFSGIADEVNLRVRSAWISVGIGWGLLTVGVISMWMGCWRPNVTGVDKVHITPIRAATRFLITYILGIAAVNVWRAVWYLADYFVLPTKLTANAYGDWPLTSYWMTSVVGSSACFFMWSGASILAPPAIFLLDGPGVNSPPMTVTLLSSHYSVTLPAKQEPPKVHSTVIVLDMLISFVAIPIMVVFFWRGSWLVLDYYLWGFSVEPIDLNLSVLWSTLLALGLMVPTSESIFSLVSVKNKLLLELLGRFRTFVLAWGLVNFWRIVWYIWDIFLGGPSLWSACLSHVLAIVGLTVIGCLACIVAPPSTMGVDSIPHPDCADDPLFCMLPVCFDDLYLLGIGRQPKTIDAALLSKELEMTDISDWKETPSEDPTNKSNKTETDLNAKWESDDGSPIDTVEDTPNALALKTAADGDEGEKGQGLKIASASLSTFTGPI